MRLLCVAALLATTTVSPVLAQTVTAPEPQTTTLNDRMGSVTEPPLAFLRLKSLFEPGEVAAPGDRVKVSREFSNWTMLCETRPSLNRRLCSVEQFGESGNGTISWRIATNVENKLVVVFRLPADFNVETGLRMKFSGLEKNFGAENFKCLPNYCIGGFIFEGFVQRAIESSEHIAFSYARPGGENVALALSMNGYDEAFRAAQSDPFGTHASSQVAEAEALAARKAATGSVAGSGSAQTKRAAVSPARKPARSKPERTAKLAQVKQDGLY